MSIRPRLAFALFLVPLAGCGLLYEPAAPTAAQAAAIETAAAEVTAPGLLLVLADLDCVRSNGDPGLPAVEARITARLASAGYAFSVHPSGAPGGSPPPMNSFIAELPGARPELEPVYTVAHWDSAPSSGHSMDDNASGAAAVLRIAEILATRSFQRTIRFALFGNEELGLAGSKRYVRELSAAELPHFFINFEMIGYTNAERDAVSAIFGQERGDWIGAFAPDGFAACLADFAFAARRFAPGLRFCASTSPVDYADVPILSRIIAYSDHVHFWNRGAPGIMLHDGACNPHYHTPGDALDTIDPGFMAAVVRAVLAAICLRADIIPP